MVNISDLISKYNPPPHVSQHFGEEKSDPHNKTTFNKKPPLHPNLPRKFAHQQSFKRHSPKHREPSYPKQSNNYKQSMQHQTISRKAKNKPLQLENYIKTLRNDNVKEPLAQRKTIIFAGKRKQKEERRKTTRVEKHVKCANVKVLRKLLRKKDVKTSRNTPPHILNTLSKLLIGTRINITK